MIEVIVTPLALAAVAGYAGWKSGRAARRPLRDAARRLRAGILLAMGRTPLCDECRRTASVAGACHVLCDRCDPVVLAFLARARD